MRLPGSRLEATDTSLQLVAVSVILGVLTYLSRDYFYIIVALLLTAYLAFLSMTFSQNLKTLKNEMLPSVETDRRRSPIGRPIKVSVTVTNPLTIPIRILGTEWSISLHGVKAVDPQDLQVVLQPKERYTFQRELKTKTGGRLDFESVALRVSDRRGFFKSQLEYPSKVSVEVHPTPLPTRTLSPLALYGGETHPSITRPIGTDYATSRQYVPGDDLQIIDWKATARLSRLMAKEFYPEANFPILILLETSESMNRPAYVGTRLDEAAAIAHLLSKVAVSQGDPVGLISYSEDKLLSYMKPSNAATQVTRILDLLMSISRELVDSPEPEPETPRPLRTVVREIEELEILKQKKETSQFAEKILPILKLSRTIFFVRLQRQGLFQAFTTLSAARIVPSVIVVLTDLQTQLHALIEGARAAQRKGHRVVAVQVCAPWRIERDLEKCYIEYQKNRRILTQLASNEISTIDTEPEVVLDALNREMAKTRLLRFPTTAR